MTDREKALEEALLRLLWAMEHPRDAESLERRMEIAREAIDFTYGGSPSAALAPPGPAILPVKTEADERMEEMMARQPQLETRKLAPPGPASGPTCRHGYPPSLCLKDAGCDGPVAPPEVQPAAEALTVYRAQLKQGAHQENPELRQALGVPPGLLDPAPDPDTLPRFSVREVEEAIEKAGTSMLSRAVLRRFRKALGLSRREGT